MTTRLELEDAFYQQIEATHDAVDEVKSKMQIVGSCFDEDDIAEITLQLAKIEEKLREIGA